MIFWIFLTVFVIFLVIVNLAVNSWAMMGGVTSVAGWFNPIFISNFFNRDKSKDDKHPMLVNLVNISLLVAILSGILAIATYFLKI